MEKARLKSQLISLRLTESEAKKLNSRVAKMRVPNRSQFVKAALFTRPIILKKVDENFVDYLAEVRRIRNQLAGLTNNMNQLVKVVNTDKSVSAKQLGETKKMLEEVTMNLKLYSAVNNKLFQMHRQTVHVEEVKSIDEI